MQRCETRRAWHAWCARAGHPDGPIRASTCRGQPQDNRPACPDTESLATGGVEMGNRSILHAAGRLSVSLLIPLLLLGVTDVHAQTATITGRVTSAESGQPLQEAQISVVGTSLGGLTNAEGRYTITGVPLGTVEVRAQ